MTKLTSLILLSAVLLTPLQTRAASFSAFEETGVVQIVAYNDEETHGRGQVWNQAFLEHKNCSENTRYQT